MTKRVFETVTVFAIAVLALAAFVPAASAQSKVFNFVVPFDFYAGTALMPAGVYTITQTSFSRATQIYDRKGHVTSVLPIVGGIDDVISNNRMVFNRYGNVNFLSEIQWAHSGTGYRLRESKLEREARLSSSPVRIAIQPEK